MKRERSVNILLVSMLLLVGILFVNFFLVSGEVVKSQKSFRELIGLSRLRPAPLPMTSLLVTLQTSRGEGVNGIVNLYNETHGLVASLKISGKNHVLFENLAFPQKGKEFLTYTLEVKADVYEDEFLVIVLARGIENLQNIYLSKKEILSACFDSDGGINSLVSGFTKMSLLPKKEAPETRLDICHGSKLSEQYCDQDRILASEQISCSGFCISGRCIVAPFCKNDICIPLENASCYSSYSGPFMRGGASLQEEIPVSERQKEKEHDRVLLELVNSIIEQAAPRQANLELIPSLRVGVYDAEEQIPIHDASVWLEDSIGGYNAEYEPPSMNIVEKIALYRFKQIPVGTYALIVAARGYEGTVLKIDAKALTSGADANGLLVSLKKRRIPKVIELWNTCLDTKNVSRYSCSSVSSSPLDQAQKPAVVLIECPNGYHCGKEKCIQDIPFFSATLGDVDSSGKVDGKDVAALQKLLASENVQYNIKADLDEDGRLDPYDLYRLQRIVRGEESMDPRLPVHTFDFITPKMTVYNSTNYTAAKLIETQREIPLKTWEIEYTQKGNSRISCKPPVLNVKFKKKDLFFGMTTYASAGSTLGYQKVKFLPDCDILQSHEVDNQLREYVMYSTFRKSGVPAVDIVGFAQINFTSIATDQLTAPKQYMLLQRDNEKDDQIPFIKQFGMSELLDSVDFEGGYYNILPDKEDNRKSRLIGFMLEKYLYGQEEQKPTVREVKLDPNTSIRYFMLTDFFSLWDRGHLGNEHYGLDANTGYWRSIPFDLDSSFSGCYFYKEELNNTLDIINKLPASQQPFYRQRMYTIARELFDNPETLYSMLSLVDKYPFEENKNKMKNTLRAKFYYAALYYGSEAFAKDANVPYVPFVHQVEYLREAKRILAEDRYETICSDTSGEPSQDYRALEQFVNPKNSGNGDGGSVAVPAPAPRK